MLKWRTPFKEKGPGENKFMLDATESIAYDAFGDRENTMRAARNTAIMPSLHRVWRKQHPFDAGFPGSGILTA